MSDELAEISLRVVGHQIIKILNESITFNNGMSRKHHKQGYFKISELTQGLRNNKEVMSLSDDSASRSTPIMGIEKCIAYMTRMDLIFKDKPPGSPNAVVYKVTETFLATYK